MRRGLRRDPARSGERAAARRSHREARVKTSLGIWAFGAMVTRFVPVGYKPELGRRDDRRARARRGRGARRPDRRLRVPLPAGAVAREPRRGPRGARRPRHLLPRERPAPRSAVRQGRVRARPTTACAPRRSRRTLEAVDFAGEIGATSSSGPGSRATTTRSRRRTRESLGAVRRRGSAQAAERCARARRDDLPRAQELGAGDEDPDAEHRHDAARDPQAARAGASTTSRSTWTGST